MVRQKNIIKNAIKMSRVTVQAEFNWHNNVPAINTVINLPVPLNARSNFTT
jgi:hypothetical protein